MFTSLPESRGRRTRRVGGTLLSVVVHGVLVTGAVALTFTRPVQATPGPIADTVIFIRPPEPPRQGGRSAGRPPEGRSDAWQRPIIDVVPPDVPPGPVIDVTGPKTDDRILTVGPVGTGAGSGGSGEGLGSPDGVVDALVADRTPQILGRAAAPRYPSSLRGAGIEGRVVLQFVVDTLGRAEPDGVQVMETSHALFTDAVREALPRFRFSPGEAGGRKVRTRVMMPFVFTLAR